MGISILRSGQRKTVPLALTKWRTSQLLLTHHCVLSLWDVATGKELHSFTGHEGAVQALAASSDGRWLASGSRDGAVYLWNASTHQLAAALSASGPPVKALVFSANSQTLVALLDGGIRAWDMSTRAKLPAIQSPSAATELAFSAGGSILAVGHDNGMVSFWDARTGKLLRQLQANPIHILPDGEPYVAPISALALSPDGATLAVGVDRKGSVCLLDARTGGQRRTISRVASRPRRAALTFSADGKTLMIGAGQDVMTLVEVATGKPRHRLIQEKVAGPGRLHSYLAERMTWSYKLAFSPDHHTFATWGHQNDLIRLWDSSTGAELAKLYGHAGYVNTVTFAADGRTLFSAGEDTAILVWKLDFPRRKPARERIASAEEAEKLWKTLAGGDVPAAYQTVTRLAAAPEYALPLCRSHLRPIPPPDVRLVERLITNLDSREFSPRRGRSGRP